MRNPVKIHVAITAAESSFKVTTANSTVSASVSALDTAPEGQAVSSSLTNCLVMIYPPDENLSLLVAFLKQHKEDEKIMICFLTRSFVELYVLILKQLNQEEMPWKDSEMGDCWIPTADPRSFEPREAFCSAWIRQLVYSTFRILNVRFSLMHRSILYNLYSSSSWTFREGRKGRILSCIFLTAKEDTSTEFL